MVAPMLRFKQIAGVGFNTFFFAVTLFVPAGTVRWPRAWIFLGVVFVGTAVTTFVLPEELLNERYKPPVQRGQPLFDQIGIFAFVGSFVAAVLFIPFDVFRLHLLRPPDIVTSIFGLALFAAGWTLITVAIRANDPPLSAKIVWAQFRNSVQYRRRLRGSRRVPISALDGTHGRDTLRVMMSAIRFDEATRGIQNPRSLVHARGGD